MRTLTLRRPWSRRGTDDADRRAWRRALVATVAVGTVVAIVVSGLVAVLSDPPDEQDAAADRRVPVAMAAAFVAGVVTADRDRRARTIGAFVAPHRVPEFVEVLDEVVGSLDRGDADLVAVPRAVKVVESSETVRVVLVLVQVDGAPRAVVDAPDDAWQVWGVGVTRTGVQWRVFSYEGMVDDVRPGDPRLDGFEDITPQGVP